MSHPTVLIVDDDDDDRLLIKLGFEANDFSNTCEFENALSVLKYLKANATQLPRLIVSDLNMPKTSGLDMLKEIKANDELNKIHVIILSTSSSQKHIDDCLEAGAVAYYVKPTHSTELNAIAKEILLKVNRLSA